MDGNTRRYWVELDRRETYSSIMITRASDGAEARCSWPAGVVHRARARMMVDDVIWGVWRDIEGFPVGGGDTVDELFALRDELYDLLDYETDNEQ